MTEFHPPPGVAGLLDRVASAADGRDLYIVGGTVRDVLLGRDVSDVDLAITGDARVWSRQVADQLGGHFVALDDERDVARIVLDGDMHHIDVAALQGTVDEDLRRRDYTVDAMAVRAGSTEVIDPLDGRADLAGRRLRMVSIASLEDDPLRLLRGARLAAELSFSIEPQTAAAISARASSVLDSAPERRRDELYRIFGLDEAEHGVRVLDSLGLLDVLLPEVASGKGVEQPAEHAYDVFEHNVHTVGALDLMLAKERPSRDAWMWDDLWAIFAWCEQDLGSYFREQMSEGRTRGALLKLAGLLHDVAKPETRKLEEDGRTRFFGHSDVGARMAGEILRRYRFSAREARWVALLVEEHLRPVQLAPVGEAPTRRALHRFFKDLGDAAQAVLFLSLADAAAARGPKLTREGWRRQAAYMNSLLVRSFEDEGIVHPPRLLTGYDIMSELSLPEGPEIGRLLSALEEAQAAGDVADREQALAFVREQARGASGEGRD